MSSGYSKTPLAKKLGLKAGFKVLLLHQPDHYLSLFSDLPEEIEWNEEAEDEYFDFIHCFVQTKKELENASIKLKPLLKKSGLLWMSWPKGKSRLPSEVNREMIREQLLAIGLVDTKVAAIDEDWSGLKFVYRLKDR